MQKNYRFSKKQESIVLITVGVQIWRQNLILARSTLHMGVKAPHPHSSPHIKTKVRWLRMTVEKNPTLIAFFKLLLGDVKVDILWIFWTFFGGFLDVPPLPPNHWPPHFFRNERCWGGTYIKQVLVRSRLWFLSFQFANIFVVAESTHNNTPNPSIFSSWRIKIC